MKATQGWPKLGDTLQMWVDGDLAVDADGNPVPAGWIDGFKVVNVREPVGPTPGPLRLMVRYSMEKIIGGELVTAHNVGFDIVRFRPHPDDNPLVGRKFTRCLRMLGVTTNRDNRWGHITYGDNLDVDLPVQRVREMASVFREHGEQGTLRRCFRGSADDEDSEILARAMSVGPDGRVQEPEYYGRDFDRSMGKFEFAWEDLEIYKGALVKQFRNGNCTLENKAESWVCNDVSVARVREAGTRDTEKLFGQKVRGYRHLVGRVVSCFEDKRGRKLCNVAFEDGSQGTYHEHFVRNSVNKPCVSIPNSEELRPVKATPTAKKPRHQRDVTSPVSGSPTVSEASASHSDEGDQPDDDHDVASVEPNRTPLRDLDPVSKKRKSSAATARTTTPRSSRHSTPRSAEKLTPKTTLPVEEVKTSSGPSTPLSSRKRASRPSAKADLVTSRNSTPRSSHNSAARLSRQAAATPTISMDAALASTGEKPTLDLSGVETDQLRESTSIVLTTKIGRRPNNPGVSSPCCSVCRADDDQSFLVRCTATCDSTWHLFCLPPMYPCRRPFVCPSCISEWMFAASCVRIQSETNDTESVDIRPEFLVPGKGWLDSLPAVMISDHSRAITKDPILLAAMLDRASLYIRVLQGAGQTSWHFLNGAPLGITQYTALEDFRTFVSRHLSQQVKHVLESSSIGPDNISFDVTGYFWRKRGKVEFASHQTTAIHILIRALEKSPAVGPGKVCNIRLYRISEAEPAFLQVLSESSRSLEGDDLTMKPSAVWVQLSGSTTLDFDHFDQEIEAPHGPGDISVMFPSALGAFNVSARTSSPPATAILLCLESTGV